MRTLALAISLLVVATLLAPVAAAEDFGEVAKVTSLIRILSTPQLAPGDRGEFVFFFNSTYETPIRDVRLNASIYRYATIEESVAVDDTWRYAYPIIEESESREWVWTAPEVNPDDSSELRFTIVTAADSRDMPHGSIFSQASYFIRFWLEFNATSDGNTTQYRFASRGFFSNEAWTLATSEDRTQPCTPPWCRGNLNVSVLGIDGLLADSGFGVKEPIPRWPFYALIAAAVLFLVLAFLFWVEENPGSYPRVEAWWARTRGRLARTFAPLRPTRRPKS